MVPTVAPGLVLEMGDGLILGAADGVHLGDLREFRQAEI